MNIMNATHYNSLILLLIGKIVAINTKRTFLLLLLYLFLLKKNRKDKAKSDTLIFDPLNIKESEPLPSLYEDHISSAEVDVDKRLNDESYNFC